MPKRRKLGTTYTRSPVQNMKEGLGNNFTKILFAIFCSVIFFGILYVMVGIVVFLGTHFSDWDEGTRTVDIFSSVYCLPVKVIGIIGVFLYVFKDNLTKR